MYSQNNEEQIILEYFKDFKGTAVDIGANDGVTFSNTKRLSELGWDVHLIEPSESAYNKLIVNTVGRYYNFGIHTYTGKCEFFINDPHIPNDDSLLATAKAEEKNRWRGVYFKDSEIDVKTWEDFTKISGVKDFDFITIDCEGLDLDVLKQIDLTNTKMLIVEWNGKKIESFTEHVFKYNLKLHSYNAENLIFVK